MKQQRIRAWITFLITFAMLFSIGNSYRSTAENNILSAEEKTYSDVTESSQALSLADQCSILNYVDEKEFMSNGFTKRVYSEEDLNTYIFEREDGTRGLYMFAENVKFEDETGLILEKDISLEKTAAGYSTKQNNVGLLLPDKLSEGVKVSFGEEELFIFAPEGNNIESEKNGNSVKYVNAYGENAHLVLTPTLSGLKQDIVLDNYTEQNQFDIIVVSESLKPFYDKEGSLFFAKTESDDYRFNVSSVFIYDSFGHFSGGDIHIEQIAVNKWILTLLVPEEFLVSDNTVYPVTIDPKIEKKSETDSSYIEDTTIYSGKPNLATGTWAYNHTGFLSDGYNIGRMLVRTPGLYNDSEFSGIQASQIDSAKFYIKEATGSASQEVKLYAYTGVSWSENTATWNNTSPNGSYTLIDTKYPSYGDYAEYNVTNLVKGWKNGTYSASLGFMLKSSDESNVSNAKAFDASESAYSNVQPYIVVYYRPQLFLFSYAVDLNEGESFANLAITDPTTTVQWTSSNPTVATVNSAGVITGVRASATPVTITATVFDPYGPALSKTCTVYVKIPNGVYHIKNLNSNFYLHVNNGGISNLTDVIQYYKYLDNADDIYKIRQMWKVFYLGNGRYSIRPLSKLDKGLDVTGGNVDIYNIGTSDTLSDVPNYGEWTIDCYSSGYVFKNNGSDSLTMQVNNDSYSLEASVVASSYSTNSSCRWSLTPVSSSPAGAYLYDLEGESITATSTRDINVGTTNSLLSMQISAVAYSGVDISQDFTWCSSNNAIATIGPDGAVTGVSPGKTTITGCIYRNDAYHYVSYTIYVGFSFETTITNLEELYDVALEYNSTPYNAVLLTLQFIRRIKYSGSAWNTVAGMIDSQFVYYVETNYPSLYDFFTVDNTEEYYYLDPNGEGYVDFTHFCATMNGLLYDSVGFRAALAGEGNINNLCGWAGDLQTLCIDVLGYTNNSNDYSVIYNATYSMIGNEAYSLSMMDLLADTDAYNVYQLLNNSSSNFTGVFTSYYDDYVGTRYTQFTNGWGKQTIYSCVRNYTTNIFFLWIDWPLLEGYDISNTQADAIAWAFTDYIWEKIQNE